MFAGATTTGYAGTSPLAQAEVQRDLDGLMASVADITGRVVDVTSRLCATADRLYGTEPTNGMDPKPDAKPYGAIADLSARLVNLSVRVGELERQANRVRNL